RGTTKNEDKKTYTSKMAAPAMEGAVVTALRTIMYRVQSAAEKSARKSDQVRVVAVSKTKPVSLIRQVYDAGHRCFGENYVQEFIEKAPQLPDDIEWHFIGNLQSNKVKPLLTAVPNLAMVESVDDEKLEVIASRRVPVIVFVRLNLQGISSWTAVRPSGCVEHIPRRPFGLCGKDRKWRNLKSEDKKVQWVILDIANYLDRYIASFGRKPLKVLVQVNTSGEASKSGVEPSSCVELAKHVKMGCPNLEFSGLMTIGMLDYTSTPENFKTLSNCRAEVCKALGMTEEQCELSMGMSGDFEKAIEMGSTNVRIGSTIFGPREYPKKQGN
ncbi:hypothetical protein IFM89_011860, partial [Coptis chinensis]